MKKFALVAGALLLAACSETQPTDLSPKYSKGAPAGLGDCAAPALKDAQKGRITPGSCNSNEALGRRSQYYTATTPAAGQQLTVKATSEVAMVLGIKQDNADVLAGMTHAGFLWDLGDTAGFSFIGASPTQQVFLSNRFAGETGAYTMTSAVEPISYSCDVANIYEAPVSFTTALDGAHACHGTIRFSPFPEAIGQPLWFQTYYGKLLPGKSYEVSVAGNTPAFNTALTIFRNGAYNPALQSAGPVPADGVRRIIVTPPAAAPLATYYIEVSTMEQAGSFTLTIREL